MKHVLLFAPATSGAVFGLWLLLNNTFHPAHVALGAALALTLPRVTGRLQSAAARVRKPRTLLRLLQVVLWDIVISNIAVARQILGREAELHPRFVWVPLDIREPYGISTLAAIITMTPGTLSADLSADRRHLLVHALHAPDADAIVAEIKRRYEAPLMEIFA